MKTEERCRTRLNAEVAACKTDPTLNDNEFVQGYMEGLKFVLEDDKP